MDRRHRTTSLCPNRLLWRPARCQDFGLEDEEELKLEPDSATELKEGDLGEKKVGDDLQQKLEKTETEAGDKENPYLKQKIISQTLGEILVSQKKYKEARQRNS